MSHHYHPHHHRSKLPSTTLPLPMHSKMIRHSLLKQTLASLSIILALYLFLNTFFLSPYTLDETPTQSQSSTSSLSSLTSIDHKKVKIYMYDLPNKFTYGVIENYALSRNPKPNSQAQQQQPKYPGNQHSAEWHLFSYFKNDQTTLTPSTITRVLDPDDADLFYVPFFSSLSLVANPVKAGSGQDGVGTSYSDEEMQESLVEWLEEQEYWKRNNGWDHVIIAQDPNALFKVIDRVRNSVLLVSDFGRLRSDQASLVKDVILPYSHRINSFKGGVGVEKRESLLFFMGNRYRKEGGKIRDVLFQILENEDGVVIKHGAQSRESRRAATQGMHSSKFCLHPAGDTPSACRLFDAIVSLCVPVIISDHIELPFEDVIDYKKIAIFVDTTSAVKRGFLVNLLRGVSEDRILDFQQELMKVKHYFEYEDPNGTVNEIWRQVSMKLPLIKLMINRDKRLVTRELQQPDCACLCSNRTGVLTTL